MDFESKIQKAYVIDKSTCLGIGEHEQFKGSNLEIRDGILKVSDRIYVQELVIKR